MARQGFVGLVINCVMVIDTFKELRLLCMSLLFIHTFYHQPLIGISMFPFKRNMKENIVINVNKFLLEMKFYQRIRYYR